jgi:hypothetical protein
MRNNIKYLTWKYTVVIIIISGLFFSDKITFAQDEEPLRIYLDIMCYQKSTEIDLKANVRARIGENRKILPVSDIPIDFFNLTDSSEVLLGNALTNEDGNAVYTVKKDSDLLWDQEIGYRFSVSFDGNEKFKSASKEISIREARIEINFDEIDSIKVIVANAYEIDLSSSERIPLDGVDLSFYVPGSFSLYRIGEGVLTDGTCTVDFPVSLPGDFNGNLTITAKIEESDDYGFVEVSAIKDWGTAREPANPEERRGLGDTDAPLWMVYTLIVLLSAVWIHYIYVFVVIYLIKKESKKVR